MGSDKEPEEFKLPTRVPRKWGELEPVPTPGTTKIDELRSQHELTRSQAGLKFVEIGAALVEIWKIRESTDADVRKIRAESDRELERMAAEVRKIRASGGLALDRAEAARRLMTEFLPAIESIDDPVQQRKALGALPILIDSVLNKAGAD